MGNTHPSGLNIGRGSEQQRRVFRHRRKGETGNLYAEQDRIGEEPPKTWAYLSVNIPTGNEATRFVFHSRVGCLIPLATAGLDG